jgi:hypothetical protein
MKKIYIACLFQLIWFGMAIGSSHREAPMIADDPLADNVDLYAFRTAGNWVTIIATYVPGQLPQGGPNYYNFGTNVFYEIHIDNNVNTPGDDLTYRLRFYRKDEDPSTFFNIRLGKQNLRLYYDLQKSDDRGKNWVTILAGGSVTPPNIGARSIQSAVGLNTSYQALVNKSIRQTMTGERVYVGHSDDPFFVDLGGIFDLGDSPRSNGKSIDNLACKNVSTIAIQIPMGYLLNNQAARKPTSILDPNYVIGVWASASRRKITTLSKGAETSSGDWVQVSRLGMPLTNEAVIPIGYKDYWNALSPYDEIKDTLLDPFFYNPELGLYMDDSLFGGAVPSLSKLRIQRKSLGAFDFGNGKDGLYILKGNAALAGTALDDKVFGTLLLPGPGKPRAVDLWPIFHTGVPNVIPYQLATGKNGNPLATGKPFVHNFLPNGGDMLRLNMAVDPTPRNSKEFSSLGLIAAAVAGLTDPKYASNANLEWIPNMDGFPNGRRLEDDVTRIELMAVSGVALAAVGLWYDDFVSGGSPVTPKLLNVLSYTTGVEKNDVDFKASFPYVALPWAGDSDCGGELAQLVSNQPEVRNSYLGLATREIRSPSIAFEVKSYPNPFTQQLNIKLDLPQDGRYQIEAMDIAGRIVEKIFVGVLAKGDHLVTWQNTGNQPAGPYFIRVSDTESKKYEVVKVNKL